VATQAHASVTDLPLLCRLARTAATLGQTAAMLERSLIRYHQKPAPYFGTVLSDAVDIPALDATWHRTPDHQPQPAADAAPPPMRRPPDPPNPPAQPTPPSAVVAPAEPEAEPQPDRPPHPDQQAAPKEWRRIKLDEGPGWSREVLRHRSSQEPESGSTP